MSHPKNNFLFSVIFIIIISLIYSWPYFRKGFFLTDDGIWAVVRVTEMVRELKDLQIPPRWSDFLNHGFGYPLFSFTYPLPFFLGAILKLIGFSYVTSVKVLFVTSFILSGIFMYLFVRLLIGVNLGAVLSALFYVVNPYHLKDLYLRGSLGESISFTLFPLIFYFTLKLFNNYSKLIHALLTLLISSLFLTHNVMALFFLPVWIIFVCYLVYKTNLKIRNKLLMNFLNIFLISVSISSFFIIPVLFEKKYIYLSVFPLVDRWAYFLNFNQFLKELSWPQLLTIIMTFFLVLFNKSKFKSFHLGIYWLTLFLLVMTFLLNLSISSPFWRFSLLSSIDFPWRILALSAFFSSIISAYLVVNKYFLIFGLILLFYSLIINFSIVYPKKFITLDDSFYYTNDATTTSKDELTPIWVVEKPKSRYGSKVEIISGNAQVKALYFNSKSINFSLNSSTSGIFQINTIYFPGWQLYENGKNATIDYKNRSGLIRAKFNEGESNFTGMFRETPVRLISDIISIIGLAFLLAKIFYVRKS